MFTHTKTVIKNSSNPLFLLRFLFELFGANFPEARILHNYYADSLDFICSKIIETSTGACVDHLETIMKYSFKIVAPDMQMGMHHAPTR